MSKTRSEDEVECKFQVSEVVVYDNPELDRRTSSCKMPQESFAVSVVLSMIESSWYSDTGLSRRR